MRNRCSKALGQVLVVVLASVVLLPGIASSQLLTCEIEYPVNHERVHEAYIISGTAHTENGTIDRVEIRIEEEPWIVAQGNASWSYAWHTTNLTNGEYTIYARSFDGTNYSAVVNVTVDVHNPTDEEKMLGEMFFWALLILVVIIAVAGIVLEIRRRKQA